MTSTARGAASVDPMAVGSGVVDAYTGTFSAPSGTANAGLDRSNGLGALDESRGTVEVQADDSEQTIVNGLLTLQLLLWNPIVYVGVPWNSLTWSMSQWYGNSWHGNSWHGNSWHGNSWHGSTWYGNSWHGNSWHGNSWHGSAWYGAWE
jgi:hypothetical protein